MASTPKPISGLLYQGGNLIRDGERAAGDLRPAEIVSHFISSAEGSVLIRLGETQVICAASVEEGVPQFLKGSGRGWVTGEYSMIPRATETRTAREVNKGRPGGRTMEIQRLIGRSLRAVVDAEALGERTVWVDCDVIRADGGTRTASITGSLVAMGLAFQKLREMKVMHRMPLKDYLAAISIGIIGKELLLDLNFAEDSHADVDMNIVMTGAGKFVEVQATAEGRTCAWDEITQMVDIARPAIAKLIELQQSVLRLDLPGAR